MTDKEKILVKIESMLNEINYEPFTDEVFGRIQSLKELKSYIDSLQEKPKFKIGDIIRFKGNETLEGEEKTHKIVGYDNELYIFDDGTTDLFCEQELYELVKEHVSEDLEEAANTYVDNWYKLNNLDKESYPIDVEISKNDFKAGAQWQKANLWKPADGDDLPEIDKEVIVLYQRYPLESNEYAVGFAHIPPEYWDGKNIETDKVTRYYPKRYDKGGWNIPDVKFWLDCDLPKWRNRL